MGNVQVPAGARKESAFRAAWEGHTLRVTLFTGHASDGYKSDFTRRPARWIVWERFDESGKRVVRRATRYGGNRFAQGTRDYAECVQQLRDAGVHELTEAVPTR